MKKPSSLRGKWFEVKAACLQVHANFHENLKMYLTV
jgi:hypothetical protein